MVYSTRMHAMSLSDCLFGCVTGKCNPCQISAIQNSRVTIADNPGITQLLDPSAFSGLILARNSSPNWEAVIYQPKMMMKAGISGIWTISFAS